MAKTREPQQEILKGSGNQSVQSLHFMDDETEVKKNGLLSGMEHFSNSIGIVIQVSDSQISFFCNYMLFIKLLKVGGTERSAVGKTK